MPRHTQLLDLKSIDEINLTPMMDLVFVLLITFMITFPLIEHHVPIELPAGEAIPVEDPNAMEVTIDKDGGLFLGENPISKDALLAALTDARGRDPQLEVNIRGDEDQRYGEIMDIIRMLNQAKITNLGLVTDGKRS